MKNDVFFFLKMKKKIKDNEILSSFLVVFHKWPLPYCCSLLPRWTWINELLLLNSWRSVCSFCKPMGGHCFNCCFNCWWTDFWRLANCVCCSHKRPSWWPNEPVENVSLLFLYRTGSGFSRSAARTIIHRRLCLWRIVTLGISESVIRVWIFRLIRPESLEFRLDFLVDWATGNASSQSSNSCHRKLIAIGLQTES